MTPRALVDEHLRCFNERDLDGLLTGLTDDAVWITGRTRVMGTADLRDFFAAAFEHLLPRLHVRSIVAEGGRVACELTEIIGGREYPIAGFYRIRDGRISAATIYREGSAALAVDG